MVGEERKRQSGSLSRRTARKKDLKVQVELNYGIERNMERCVLHFVFCGAKRGKKRIKRACVDAMLCQMQCDAT